MADNSYTKTYVDGSALLEADLDASYKSLQPAQGNLAYATTGSSSGDILASTGSNAVPGWLSPDEFAATIGASGANQILSNVSSVVASIANLIIGAISSCQATTANLIAESVGASGANFILGAISSCQATTANLIVDAVTRSVATSVTHLGVAISPSSGLFQVTSSTFTDITNFSVTIQTSGRPVMLQIIPSSTTSSYVSITGTNSNLILSGALKFLQGTSTLCTQGIQGGFASSTAAPVNNYIKWPPGSFVYVDTPAAGTYSYSVQMEVDFSGTVGNVSYCKLMAREL